jgi:hypothetical protein
MNLSLYLHLMVAILNPERVLSLSFVRRETEEVVKNSDGTVSGELQHK